MKKLLLAATILLSNFLYFSCGKKDATPGYYFKFKADGIQYNYKYGCETGFVGTSCNIGAGQGKSSSFNPYFIYGYSLDNPAARGEVRFFLNKDDFDNLDTIVLDGGRNRVSVQYLSFGGKTKHYSLASPLVGKLIFIERNESILKANFEFQAGNADGTILTFSNGEFFVRRTN